MGRLGTNIALITILACSPFFFVGGPGYHSSRSFQAIWDLGHIFIFTLLTLVILFHWNRPKSDFVRRYFFYLLFLLIFLIGIGVELCQTMVTGRNPDIFDLLRNQLGYIFGYYLFFIKRLSVSRRKIYLLHLLMGSLLSLSCVPLFTGLGDELLARSQFPMLADFESMFEKNRWMDRRQLRISSDKARSGNHSLLVRLSTATYSGTSLFYFPKNWKGYKLLHFSVFNPNAETLTLHCRIHDKQHNKKFQDRYHRQFVLQPGWNDLNVSLSDVENAPKTRKMDMTSIEQVGFFFINLPRPQYIYLDHIFLTD
ncbi:MAG: VanZ family protein [Desulfobulbaceae bacterium]|nr:VanZ family protein [Desulfobulbaceae bacterium]